MGNKASLNMIVVQHLHILCHALQCCVYKRTYLHSTTLHSYTVNLLCLIKQTHIRATLSSSVSFNAVYGTYRTCTLLTVAHGHLPHFLLPSL
jgi:hypothetical protein